MDVQAEKEKRKVHRSPSYPVFNLADAIQKAEVVYKAEKRTATTAEVIASHMGYSQANGPGGRAVSALRQFGLLEEVNGKDRISDVGYTLIHYDRKSSEWKRAASEAALHPPLFKELAEKHSDGLPSDATLRNELLGRGFNPAAISDVVSIIKETMSLAEPAANEYTGTSQEDNLVSEGRAAQPLKPPPVPPPANIPQSPEVRQDVFSLTEGPVTIQWPSTLSAESFEDLGDWLDIVKRKIGRSVASDAKG